MKYRNTHLVVMITGIMLGLASCNLMLFEYDSDDDRDSASQGTGTLTITMAGISAQSLLQPDIEMDVATLVISGSGPFDQSFSESIDISSSSFTIEELISGAWIVTAEVLNTSSQVIGRGSTEVTIEHGTTTQASIEVRPLTGDGTLSIHLDWPPETLDEPTVTGLLTDASGGEVSIQFDVTNTSASYSGSVAAGYYDLFIDLEGTNNRSWTHYVAVRIVEGQTTNGNLILHLNEQTGNLELSFEVDLLDPSTVTIVDAPSLIYYGDAVDLSLILDPPDDGNFEYAWLVNGTYIPDESSPTLTLLADHLNPGDNVVSVRVAREDVTTARSFNVTLVDSLRTREVSAPAEITTDQRPTWEWSAVDNAVAYRYGFSEDDWLEENTESTSFVPDQDLDAEEYTLYVQARDDRGVWSESGSAIISILVNTPPLILNDPGDQTWLQDDPAPVLDLADVFSDEDTPDQNLSFNVSGGSQITYTLDGSIATFSYNSSFVGSESITLSATDDHPTAPETTELVLTFTVQSRNRPPTINEIEDLTLLVNESQQTIDLTGITDGDPDKFQSLTVTAESSDTSVIPTPTVTYSSGETGTLNFTPAADQTGTVTITVTVTDDGGNLPDQSTSVTFTVEIVSVVFTEVQGAFFEDVTWSLDSSPYLISGPASVAVQSDATLTIEPGVEVYVNPGLALQINGTLLAIGTTVDPIRFLPANPLQSWGGIKFTSSSIDAEYDPVTGEYQNGSTLQHAEVHLAGSAADFNAGAVELNDSYPYLANIQVTNSLSNGIVALGELTSAGTIKMDSITVSDSVWAGIRLYNPSSSHSVFAYLDDIDISGSGEVMNSGTSSSRAGLNTGWVPYNLTNSQIRTSEWGISSNAAGTIQNVIVEDGGRSDIGPVGAIIDTSFVNNIGPTRIYGQTTEVMTLSGVAFIGNNNMTSSGIPVVSIQNSPLEITNSVFRDNTDGLNSIAIIIQGDHVSTISDSVFENNTVNSTSLGSKTIYISNLDSLSGNRFENNTVPSGYAIGEFQRINEIRNNTFVGNNIDEEQPAEPRFLLRLSDTRTDRPTITNNYFEFEKRNNLFLIENANSNTQPDWDLSENFWGTTDTSEITTFIYDSLFNTARSQMTVHPPLDQKPEEAPDPVHQ